MKATNIYDSGDSHEGLTSAWGLSILKRARRQNILFDCGWDGGILLKNMASLEFSPADIDKVFLSHQHWDHISGLNHVLDSAGNIDVHVPSSFSENMKKEISKKATLIEEKNPRQISKGLYTTGELKGSHKSTVVWEQSIAVDSEEGLVVFTGCSHSGVEQILKRARKFGVVKGLVGGFHGFSKLDVLSGLKFIAPCHCTKHTSEIKAKYPEKYACFKLGDTIEF